MPSAAGPTGEMVCLDMHLDRRVFLSSTAIGTLAIACGGTASHAEHPGNDDDDVTPAEDLMREHGVLRRIMYLYDEAAMRLDTRADVPLDVIASAAAMIRRVIEDYHEKLEENYLFPRFEQANKLTDLTATLRKQHERGRVITDEITSSAKGTLADGDRAKLAATLRRFNRMYRAHAAREDTVLFPEIRKLVGKKAYAELGDQFEDKERDMLGPEGFEHAVLDIAKLEQAFGLDDLAKLT